MHTPFHCLCLCMLTSLWLASAFNRTYLFHICFLHPLSVYLHLCKDKCIYKAKLQQFRLSTNAVLDLTILSHCISHKIFIYEAKNSKGWNLLCCCSVEVCCSIEVLLHSWLSHHSRCVVECKEGRLHPFLNLAPGCGENGGAGVEMTMVDTEEE